MTSSERRRLRKFGPAILRREATIVIRKVGGHTNIARSDRQIIFRNLKTVSLFPLEYAIGNR